MVRPTTSMISLSIWMYSSKSTGRVICTVSGLNGAPAVVFAGCVTNESCGVIDDAAKTYPLATLTVATDAVLTAALATVTLPPEPMGRLLATGAMVWVGPPLSARGPRMVGLVGTLRILPTLPAGM